MASSQSILDDYKDIILSYKSDDKLSNTQIVSELFNTANIATTESSIRRALARWGYDDIQEQTRTLEVEGENPHELMSELGLDSDEWIATNVSGGRWGSEEKPSYSIKASFVRKNPENFIVAAEPIFDPEFKTRKLKTPKENESKLVVICADHHAPFYDKNFHGLFCNWLTWNQPHEGFINGDLLDFPDISRHRLNPEFTASAQACINSGFRVLEDYTLSSEATKWSLRRGNHDDRIRNAIIDHNKNLYGIHPATKDGESDLESIWSLNRLLRLDELGINLLEPAGPYDQDVYALSKDLGLSHGWITRQSSGQAAYATLEALGHSIVISHTHKRSIVYKTYHELDGSVRELFAAETGCMAEITSGLGYATKPDWQQSFLTVELWPDGHTDVDHGVYKNGVLTWRGQRYE